jgi:hypothetical protein
MWLAPLIVIFAGLLPGGVQTGAQTPPRSGLAETVEKYCAACHGGVRLPSGAMLEKLDAGLIAESPEVWARAYRQLQAGTMPPVGAPRPDRATYNQALATIEQKLTTNSKAEATSQEIAEHLAVLLWNSTPDASLLKDAQRNRLKEPAVLDKQIHRMLADGRAQSFVSRFLFPWLGLDKLSNAVPDKKNFPDFDIALRDAFAKETELFLLSQLRDDRDPVELWSANYTFLNEQLARHYNIPNIKGTQFRKVTLPLPERYGLLGQGSILMITSRHQPGSAPFTSPAGRSTWIRNHYLGAPPPNPAPNAPPVKPDLPITPQTRALPRSPA